LSHNALLLLFSVSATVDPQEGLLNPVVALLGELWLWKRLLSATEVASVLDVQVRTWCLFHFLPLITLVELRDEGVNILEASGLGLTDIIPSCATDAPLSVAAQPYLPAAPKTEGGMGSGAQLGASRS